MIRLVDVYEVMMMDTYPGNGMFETERVLYDLLKERDPVANISHQKMPAEEEHCAFVRRMPYRHWYLIQDWPMTYEDAVFEGKTPEWVGSIYLTNQREVGIAIFKQHQGKGYGTEAMKLMMEMHPGKFLANISPHNPDSVKFFKRFGAKLIQNTFLLESDT